MEIKINECFFHSIIHSEQKTLKVIEGILGTGYISSPNYRGAKTRFGCNSLDEVCLTKYKKMNNTCDYRSSYDMYIPELTTLILDGSIRNNIKLYKPKLVSTTKIFSIKNREGYTNLYDEYRTKDLIPIKYIKGISIPFDALASDPFLFLKFLDEGVLMQYYNGYCGFDIDGIRNGLSSEDKKEMRIEFLNDYIKSIKDIMNENNIDIPIYEYKNKQYKLRG